MNRNSQPTKRRMGPAPSWSGPKGAISGQSSYLRFSIRDPARLYRGSRTRGVHPPKGHTQA